MEVDELVTLQSKPSNTVQKLMNSLLYRVNPVILYIIWWTHFGTVENIEKAVTDQLKAIPVSDYQRCYEEWEQRLRRFVASQGNYFEGDKLDL